MNRTKRIAVVAGIGTAVAGGLVMPIAAWAAEPTPTPSSSSTTGSGTSSDTTRGGRHGDRGQMAAKLAEALGLDEAKVTAALEEVRGTGRPSGTDKEAGREQLAEALAAKLGVSADKITAALDTLRRQRSAEAEAALSERLKAAVTAGTLTQAEADAVLKAHRAGLLGGHHGGRRGPADTTEDSGQTS
ncbi:hypothetical protein ACFFMN_37510 [Planobispora siamensis]|uniref:Clp amino terminal domain-containing protein, pathogenicity island component n=1 Tax=Planobispora siamensis TaxID=936338 RepID=A0A8J3SHQ8_9ACTN|nr:hypothetical protein [Planobispora siamensis]GIH92680.1 hypothetical protein Psi01_33100 [Planobispora siamensis]